MPSLRTIAGWLIVIGLVWYVAKSPVAAAHTAQSVASGAAHFIGGVGTFFSTIFG
jgi:hypothetical protein